MIGSFVHQNIYTCPVHSTIVYVVLTRTFYADLENHFLWELITHICIMCGYQSVYKRIYFSMVSSVNIVAQKYSPYSPLSLFTLFLMYTVCNKLILVKCDTGLSIVRS